MRKITEQISNSFLNKKSRKIGNSETDGRNFWLHREKIAKFDDDGFLWISNAGYPSNTTKERLNSLPCVRIHQKNFVWYLNNQAWGGEWVKTEFKRD